MISQEDFLKYKQGILPTEWATYKNNGVSVQFSRPFNDIAAALEIGTSVDTDRLMTTAQNDLQDNGIYVEHVFDVLSASTQFQAALSIGTSDQGEEYILIQYC